MDNKRFLKACQLREDGKLREAIDEFRTIARDTGDPIDKAGVLLNIAATFRALSEFEKAREASSAARSLVASSNDSPVRAMRDTRIAQLELSLDFEEADICGYEGKLEEALARFELLLKKYEQILTEPALRESYEMTQVRRGFILADLGRCKEALPILEEAESFGERRAEINFYLGHCYLTDREYGRAAEKLAEALRLDLPRSLVYRAHCELGIVYYRLKDYARAKLEFEKSVETADAEYIKEAQLWKWLENTTRTLGLKDQADRYSRLAMSS